MWKTGNYSLCDGALHPRRQCPAMLLREHQVLHKTLNILNFGSEYTGCPTTYITWHFFNNSKTSEDTAMRIEQEYVHCVRNEEECVCSVCLFCCNIFIGFRIIKEMPGLVGGGTPYIILNTDLFAK